MVQQTGTLSLVGKALLMDRDGRPAALGGKEGDLEDGLVGRVGLVPANVILPLFPRIPAAVIVAVTLSFRSFASRIRRRCAWV